jgi:hypothetical protein
MNRENLLKQLVDRKMASNPKDRAICVCLACTRCWAGGRPTALPKPKQ